MTRKTLATISILLILLVSMFGTVFAQDGTDPTDTEVPTTEPTDEAVPAGAKFFTHPVVQILSLYFDREQDTDTAPTDPNAPAEPTEGEETQSESGLGPIGEQIAAYHEEGMGFGVLVKLFAMAEAQKTACPDMPPVDDGTGTGEVVAPTCTAVSADELVTAFKSGGMGALFKQYGKPALLGVGHAKKALKNLPAADDTTVPPTVGANSHGKPPKVHTNNGKGNK